MLTASWVCTTFWISMLVTISTLVSTSSNSYVILPYWVQDIYLSQVASTAILLRSSSVILPDHRSQYFRAMPYTQSSLQIIR